LDWRKLTFSPTNCNDYLDLELPGAWEPLDNSIPLLDGEGKETQLSFSHGNQDEAIENGIYHN
jgi:hypothetical protein